MKEDERRGRTRVPYVSELECESGGNRLFARTHDVSTSGIFIHSSVVWDPGSQLKLKFRVGSTWIETIGEICYSLPQIGMGVRFLDLNTEHRAAIEALVENLRDKDRPDGGTPTRNIMPSGVQPVDELLGGVDRGHIYLVHGDAAGKSLFGIQFVIAGLKAGDNCALVIPYSPENAVRRFARLGYDCKKDLDSGRLAIIKYPRDAGEQVPQPREPTAVLSELEPILSETPRTRLVFDPVTTLLAGQEGELKMRARAFTAWVRSFDAAVVLIANGNDFEVVENLLPLVKESFRFRVKEDRGRVIRNMVFEKSPNIPDQTVRVDPSRGISLLKHQQTGQTSDPEDALAASTASPAGLLEALPGAQGDAGADHFAGPPPTASTEPSVLGETNETSPDELTALLDDLQEFAATLDFDIAGADARPRESFEQTAELDSPFELPDDVFAFRAQVRNGNSLGHDGSEPTPDKIDAADGRRHPHTTSRPRRAELSPQLDEARLQPGEHALPPDADSHGRRAHSGFANDQRLNSANDRASREPDEDRFKSYGEFLARIFTRIEDGLNNNYGAPFSIVSCRVPRMTADGGRVALQLFDLVHSVISACDTITTNKHNDLVILLENTDTVGASAFVTRLRGLVLNEMGQLPSIRLWSLPRPEDAIETARSNGDPANNRPVLVTAEADRDANCITSQRETEIAS
ncbi:MAG TPA: ATPase domain-containing protein [Blastocatellia bacterium]|nr:ATPase domain-containing protein [Blastocatellia bacterium]